MLNWIVGFCHKAAEIHVLGRRRLAPSGHRTPASAVGARRHNHRATDCCCVGNLIVYLIRLPQPRANPGHIALPSGYTRHSLGMPWDSAESVYILPTIFLSPLPGHLISTLARDSFHLPTKRLFPDPVTI